MPVAAELRLAAVAALLAAGCAARTLPRPVDPVPADDVEVSLFLIGDAGNPKRGGDAVLTELVRQGRAAPRASAIAFLGDNVYPIGLVSARHEFRAEAERRLRDQVAVARATGLQTVFLPGNHDWDEGHPDGWNSVRRSDSLIAEASGGLAHQAPPGGCPGPEAIDVGARLRVIMLDTQWWLHRNPKPTDGVDACAAGGTAGVLARLQALNDSAGDRRVVLLGHHPFASRGEHGGRFNLLHHLFPLRIWQPWAWIPLPLIGSAYPIARQQGITSQDMSGGANRRMREAIAGAVAARPPLVYAAGHDHSLQVFRGTVARWILVSGSGYQGHRDPVGWSDSTLYAAPRPGFMRLDVTRSGRVRLGVTVVDAARSDEAFAIWLDQP